MLLVDSSREMTGRSLGPGHLIHYRLPDSNALVLKVAVTVRSSVKGCLLTPLWHCSDVFSEGIGFLLHERSGIRTFIVVVIAEHVGSRFRVNERPLIGGCCRLVANISSLRSIRVSPH
jgi:hypothetical protein